MAKTLIDECVLPEPLSAIATGKPAADAAIAKLAAWELSAYSPVDTPNGKDYDKCVKAANTAPKAKLVALLDDAACDTGTAPFDEKRVKKLTPSQKKAYQKAFEAATHAGKGREGFLRWLMAACLPDGRKRLLEIAASKTYGANVRVIAAETLVEQTAKPAELLAVARALDPHDWDGKSDDINVRRLYTSGAQCWHAADAKKAYDALSDLVGPAATKTEAAANRARAVIDSLDEDSDPRWAATLAAVTKGKLEFDVLPALAQLPPDPAVIEPLLAYLGKNPDKVSYWHDDCVKVLARVADKRVLPYLVAALNDSWMHYEAAFEGFERAGDPAMIPVIRGWLVDNATADRTKEANAVIKKLAKQGPIPEGVVATPETAEPERERPVLVYKKCKAFKAPKLLPIDKQERDFAKLFADAGIPDAAKLLQRAVVMIPKRVDESTLALGVTKLGGHPDLPSDTAWPRVKKEPLTFLAQLDLAELSPHLPALPKSGLLAFFVDNDARTGNSYLEHARCILTPAGATLERREVPDDFIDRIFQACSVTLAVKLSMPSPSNAHVTKALKGDILAKYESDVYVDLPALPQVLGYRDHGYDAEEKATSQMLLQLTGDDQSDMEFGDCDYLSFFIDEKALAKGDFKKVWPKIGD